MILNIFSRVVNRVANFGAQISNVKSTIQIRDGAEKRGGNFCLRIERHEIGRNIGRFIRRVSKIKHTCCIGIDLLRIKLQVEN